MQQASKARGLVGLLVLLALAGLCYGNGISVTNVSLKAASAGAADVQFDVSWSNSWRLVWTNTTPSVVVSNWDAAWVFIKFRKSSTTNWLHATLAPGRYTAPAGAVINVTTDGVGAVLYREANGSGDANYTAARLRWNFRANGVAGGDLVDVSVMAIEMVYVPQGSFYVGSGGTETSAFYTYPSSLSPYAITNENAITVGTVAGNLTYGNSTYGGDQAGPISNAFPKGYNAFYCMKYEITQGEYTDFLNKLPSSTLAATRYPGNKGSYRQTIGGTWPNYTNAAPDRAANWLNWADGAAYGDWAGLRPMTELEFEKACRGPAVPVPNEYAWGNTTLVAQTNEAGVAGSGMETALPANARCNENKNLISSTDYGPTRVGIYATTNSSRIQSGASYWGIMELSGNVNERVVSAGSTTGRAFTGVHGDGVLYDGTNTVDAKVYNWPGTNAVGSGLRGGSCTASDAQELVSDRFYGAYENAARYQGYGWRGVRTAPQ